MSILEEFHSYLQANTLGKELSTWFLTDDVDDREWCWRAVNEERNRLIEEVQRWWHGVRMAIEVCPADFAMIFGSLEKEPQFAEIEAWTAWRAKNSDVQLARVYALAYLDYRQQIIDFVQAAIAWRDEVEPL